MSGAENTDVHGNRGVSAQAFDLSFFQHPQHLGLSQGVHIANFIQEDCPSMRLFELSFALLGGASKGSFFMPKKLTLNQGIGQSRAVDGNESSFFPGTAIMNFAGQQFFTRAAVSLDEDGHIRPGHLVRNLEKALHLPALSDHAPKLAVHQNLFS